MADLPLIQIGVPGTDVCPGNMNELVQTLTQYLIARFTGNEINTGPTTPSADDRDKPWLYWDASGNNPRFFSWSSTYSTWAALHPVAAGSGYRALWAGSESSLWSFDGGDGTDPTAVSPTAVSGAMWQVDVNMSGRVPIGPGTIDGGTWAGALSVGDTGGVAAVTLEEEDLPAHRHTGIYKDASSTAQSNKYGYYTSPLGVNTSNGDILFRGDAGAPVVDPTTGATGGGEAHDNLPPFYGVYLIKRTSRLYYTA